MGKKKRFKAHATTAAEENDRYFLGEESEEYSYNSTRLLDKEEQFSFDDALVDDTIVADTGKEVKVLPKDLQSIWFKDFPELENVYDGKSYISIGAEGKYVRRIQDALSHLYQNIRDGNTRNFKFVIGDEKKSFYFGEKTRNAILVFQKDVKLIQTGVLDKNTMIKLDSFFLKRPLYDDYKYFGKQLPGTAFGESIEAKIGATLENYDIINSKGKIIYDEPTAEEGKSKEVTRIKYNKNVTVERIYKDWLYIQYEYQRKGWVQQQYVHTLPFNDKYVNLHFVKSGDTISGIVQNHYKGIDDKYKDARLLAFAVARSNLMRSGVTIDFGKGKAAIGGTKKILFDDVNEEALAIWNTIQVKEGHNIWLPSVSEIMGLHNSGAIASGSLKESLLNDVTILQGYVAGFGYGLGESVIDLFIGLYELGALAVKTLLALVSPSFWGKVIKFASNLTWEMVLEAIKSLPNKAGILLTNVMGTLSQNWNQENAFERAFFRGRVIGYILMEILMLVLTEGIITSAKWVSFVLSKMGKTGELLLGLINTGREILGKESRAAKYADELKRLERIKEAKRIQKETARLQKAFKEWRFGKDQLTWDQYFYNLMKKYPNEYDKIIEEVLKNGPPGLTKDEAYAIFSMTTIFHQVALNRMLREGRLTGKFTEFIEILDEALRKMPVVPGMTEYFRGIELKGAALENFLLEHQVGKAVSYPEYIFAANNRADAFIDNPIKNIKITIFTKDNSLGRTIYDVSFGKMQLGTIDEAMFLRGSQFKVIKVKPIGKNTYEFYLKEI